MGQLDNLSTIEFQELLGDFGEVPALYRQCMGPCACCQSSLGGFTPVVGCAVCNPLGVGVSPGEIFETYTPATNPYTGGKICVQGASVGRTIGSVQAVSGDATATFDPNDYPMGQGDRLYFTSRMHDHREIVLRGSDGLTDRLLRAPVARIVSVYSDTAKITTGYQISTDLQGITWAGDEHTPAAGADYTVLYLFYLTWRVPEGTTLHRVRANNNDPFPNRVILRPFQGADTDKPTGELF